MTDNVKMSPFSHSFTVNLPTSVTRHHQRVLIILLMVMPTLLGGCSHGLKNFFGVKGFVENKITKQGIPDVEVRANCVVYAGIESTKLKKNAIRITDSDGYFYFSLSDVNYCDYVYYQASKPGYVVVYQPSMGNNYPVKHGSTIFFSMIPENELLTYYLQIIKPIEKQYSFTVKDGKETPDYAGQFFGNFVRFKCAKRVAKTHQDINFIKEHYCPVLLKELPMFERSPYKERWVDVETPCPSVIWANIPENRYYADKTAHPESSNKIDVDELKEFCNK